MDHRGLKAASVAVIVAMMPFCSALGADAFLCGTDYVVYVEAEDLEAAKRTDPCVASHFGLKVKGDATIPVAPPKTVMPVSLPVALPFRASIVDVAPKVRSVAKRSVALGTPTDRPAPSLPATDYGPVRIINASTPANVWVPTGKRSKAGDRDEAHQ